MSSGSKGRVCVCGCPLDAAAASCPMCDTPAASTTDVAREVMARVQAARYRVTRERPYFSRALLRCPIAQTGHVPTVAMDSNWRIYVNPEHVMRVTPAELAADLIHALNHGLRGHAGRGEAAAKMLGNWEDWHVAACCELNDDIAADGLNVGDHHLFPWMFNLENGQLAEAYFGHLMDGAGRIKGDDDGEGEDEDEQDSEGEGDGENEQDSDEDGEEDSETSQPETLTIGCGSAATGRIQTWELPADADSLNSAEQQVMRNLTAEAVAQHAKSRGSVPAGLARWADEVLNPQVDWRKVLASAVKRAVYHKAGRADWTWARLPRRQRQGPVQKPGMHQPVPDISIVVDTSASMSQRDLAHALGEIGGIIRKVVPGESVKVLTVDTAVGAASSVTDARRVELVGGGGTDMGVGIIEAARNRPSAIVVLTDGYTPWPNSSDARGVPVIAGLIGTEYCVSEVASGVPPWITSVHIVVDE